MGTPAYISPEQAQAVKVDQRSDIYSLGIILYEMVTGRVPFVAETPLAVILKHVSHPLPPPSTLKADIPEAIEQVILKALAKNPDDRFPTVAEFLSAWKRAFEGSKSSPETVPTVRMEDAPPAQMPTVRTQETPFGQTQGKPVPVPKASSSSRGWTGWAVGCLVGVCLLFSIGGGALFIYSMRGSPTAPPSPPPLPTEAEVIPPTGTVIFTDDFSDTTIWGILDDSTASIRYDSNGLRMRVFEKNWYVWSTPNSEMYENIRAEVTVYNNNGKTTTAFGILCSQQEVSSSFYYMVITPGGKYGILKAASGRADVFLTNNDQWGTSNLIRQNASSYRIGADCGYGILSLYVDGILIDSVYDTSYARGSVGLIARSGDETGSGDVTFDDFILASLE
jgi:hypothetical protein